MSSDGLRREMDMPPYSLLNGSSSNNLLSGGDAVGNMATQWEPQQEGGGLGMQASDLLNDVRQFGKIGLCPQLTLFVGYVLMPLHRTMV